MCVVNVTFNATHLLATTKLRLPKFAAPQPPEVTYPSKDHILWLYRGTNPKSRSLYLTANHPLRTTRTHPPLPQECLLKSKSVTSYGSSGSRFETRLITSYKLRPVSLYWTSGIHCLVDWTTGLPYFHAQHDDIIFELSTNLLLISIAIGLCTCECEWQSLQISDWGSSLAAST